MSEQFQLEDLKQLLLSEDDREVIFKLRGSEAVAFMDKLLRTLDSLRSNGKTDQLLFRAEACLLKLSQKSHLLPTSFLAENVVCDSRDPSGGGGFADVYKGRIGNNPVALKVLRIHVAGAVLAKVEKVISHIPPSPTAAEFFFFQDFCREALIWRQLKHPNILAFLGISKTAFPGRLCMVAPWMDSGNILDYLASQPTVDRKALVWRPKKYMYSADSIAVSYCKLHLVWYTCTSAVQQLSMATFAARTSLSMPKASLVSPISDWPF